MWAFSTVGGAIGVAMWNLSYALNLSINRVAQQGALEANPKKIAFANGVMGNAIGFACRFIPAMIILYTTAVIGSQTGINVADILPQWLIITLSTFGGMMAALGIGILLSFLLKEKWQFVLFLLGFMLIGNFGLDMMGVTVAATILTVLYYIASVKKEEELRGGIHEEENF